MKLLILCCVLVILGYLNYSEAKRGGGGSRGGGSRSKSSGGSSWWSTSSNKKSSSKSSNPAPVPAPTNTQVQAPKPSAPKPETKTNAHLQQSGVPNQNNQKPIGWNVPGNNQQGYKPNQGRTPPKAHSGYATKQSTTQPTTSRPRGRKRKVLVNNPNPLIKRTNINRNPRRNNPKHGPKVSPGIQQQHSYATNNQPHGGAWGNNQHGTAWGNNHQQGGAWGNQHGGGYGNNQHGYSGYGGGYNPHGGGYGGMGGGYGGMGGYGGHGGGMGGYGGGMGGYGGGMGGYGGGMGGFGGGMGGGMGGYGGYGMERKRGFFSGGSTVGNIITGMAIYHVTSSLVKGIFGTSHNSRPYTVHNYYNQPPEAREEIKLPSNMLSICEGNLTNVCTGATAICTTNNTVLCVVTMSQATPCEEGKAMCVNTTIPCADKSDPLCQNTTQEQTSTTVNLPCYTNMSVDVNLLNEQGATKNGEEYQYCVTTMAVAGPDYPLCSEESVLANHDYRSVLAGNFTYNLTYTPMMRKYQVYNQANPMQAPSGEMVLPLDVLIPCIDNATKLCTSDMVTICTGFGEIMCIQPAAKTSYCEDYNTTCYKNELPCQEVIEEDFLCQNKTEEELIVKEDKKFVNVDFPCFLNITINTNLPNFDIQTFNGTLPQMTPSSFMYHYKFCLITMSVPGPESDVCVTSKDAK